MKDVIMKIFEIKPEHIKLLKRMYVSWDDCEFGAPEIDPKRPYGNSDVYGDMAEILDIPQLQDDDEEYSDYEIAYMDRLHKNMKTVLQIGVRVGYFKPGVYCADNYSENWRPCEY